MNLDHFDTILAFVAVMTGGNPGEPEVLRSGAIARDAGDRSAGRPPD